MKVTVVSTPKLRSSTGRVAGHLKQAGYNSLFLPFTRELERHLTELVEGLPYGYIIKQLRKSGLIPEPFGAWKYYAEPLLKALPKIKESNADLQIYCYGDQFYSEISVKNALEITILTMRASATGEIDVERWRKLLHDDLEERFQALSREADFVGRKAGRCENSVCITEFSGGYIATELSEEGYNVEMKYLDLPYHFTPLETLKNEARQGEVPDERIKILVSYHIDYIQRYVLPSREPDEAYSKWVHQESRRLKLPTVM